MALVEVDSQETRTGSGISATASEPTYQHEQPVHFDAAPVITNTPAVAQSTPNALAVQGASTVEAMAAAGIGGIKFDWTSFPMIALKTDGAFEDSNGKSYGKSFTARMIESKTKYAHSFAGSTDPKNELVYSYDKITTTSGKLVADFEAELRAKGKDVQVKEYTEVLVELVSDDPDLDGDFRMLSISPYSVGKFSAFSFKLHRRKAWHSTTVEFKVGEKIRTVANPYYPWDFSITG